VTCDPQYLSIWELAHHWYDAPVAVERGPIQPAVRNMITNLLFAIVDSRLSLYEPVVLRVVEGGPIGQTSAHMAELELLPTEIESMFVSGVYDADVLSMYRLNLEGVFMWAIDYCPDDIPLFCVPEFARGRPDSKSTPEAKPRPEAEDKRRCQEIARLKWSEDDQIRIAEMARSREIQLDGNGALYELVTVIGWLREAAPDAVRNRRGRPVKKVRT
jgi:hypothetical protein